MEPSQRKIIHIDMDCFFAAVEERDNPLIRGKAIAVGGRPESRGVISASNYPARKFGIRSAMSSSEAIRRCPQLILLPTRFSAYKNESRKIREIFQNFTSSIEPLSMDEAYLDVSDSTLFGGSATLIAQEIRREIFKKLRLTASAGIAENKFLAKVASDWNKPNGQWTIAPKDVESFVKNLPVAKIPGVGKATQKKMTALDIASCADLQNKDLGFLVRHFGNWGERLSQLSRGIDNRKLSLGSQRKSLSVERTYSNDLFSWEDVERKSEKIYDEFIIRLRNAKIESSGIKGFSIKIKYENFESITRDQQCQKIPTYKEFMKLLKSSYYEDTRPIRLLGLGAKLKSNEVKKNKYQLDLF